MNPHAIGRRRFLAAAGGCVGFGLLGTRAYAQRPAPSDRVTVACVGVGGMGTGNMGDFLNVPEAHVVAVCDVDAVHAEGARAIVDDFYERPGCAVYRDYRELLDRSDIDAVMVATPDHWHALISIAALEAGKDVYCEKPLALTVEEGRAIARAVERTGRVFQHGTQLRSHRDVRHVAELVRNGVLGEVKRVEVGTAPGAPIPLAPEIPVPDRLDYDLWLGPAPYEPYTPERCHVKFRCFRDYSGGAVTDFGVHYIDYAQWALGTEYTGPVAIEGSGTLPLNMLSDIFTHYHYTCTYADGLVLDVSTENKHGATFFGSDGWIYQPLGFPGPNTALQGKETLASDPRLLKVRLGADAERLSPGWLYDDAHFGRAHKMNFIDAVKSRSTTPAPAEVAHRSTSICHLGNIAMLLGRPIRWDPDHETFLNDDDANAMLSRPMRGPWRLI